MFLAPLMLCWGCFFGFLSRVFVNAQYADNDNTDVGELMSCFLLEEINNNKFPKLSERLLYFKSNKKGVDYMSSIIQEYADEIAAEMLVNNIETLAKKLGTIEQACDMLNITEQKYKDAKELLEKSLTV